MKSIVNNSTISMSKPFPKLMIHPSTKVVIFAERTINSRPYGQIINIESNLCSNHKLGEISDWSTEFIDFDGSVTLSND